MRSGAALPMVMLTLGLVAALSVGGSFVTRRYNSDAVLHQAASELEPGVEAALVRSAAALDTTVLMALGVGAGTEMATPAIGNPPGIRVRVWITRLSATTFALVAEGETQRKQLLVKRLGVSVVLDSAVVREVPNRAWTQLP